jgi:hypothetical protein
MPVVALTLVCLLVALPTAAADLLLAPRAPVAGESVREDVSWHGTGKQRITVGGLPVKEGPVDHLERAVLDIALLPVPDGGAATAQIHVREQVEREGEKRSDLGLDGSQWSGEKGARGWKVHRTDQGKERSAGRKWVERHLDGLRDDPEDPVLLLVPDGPVEKGAAWQIPFPKVLSRLGRADVRIDESVSWARVEYLGPTTEGGRPSGRVAFDVSLKITGLKNGTVRDGRFEARGTMTLPLGEAHPYWTLDGSMAMRFLGTVRRGIIVADADMDIRLDLREARGAGE